MYKFLIKTTIITFVILLSSLNLFSYWEYTTIPGVYAGKDSEGAIICVGTENICFTLYKDMPGPSPSPGEPISPEPGHYTGVALFIPSSNYGLIGIGGVTYIGLGSNTLYSPILTPNTTEVSSENELIEWLNENYGSQQP